MVVDTKKAAMKLISDTVEIPLRKGPFSKPVYAFRSPVPLWDPHAFPEGPPYAAFAALRREAPIAWNEEPLDRPGFWSVVRYHDVMRVNADPETFSSQKGGILMAHERSEAQLAKASLDAMINMDAPAHLQLRREHMPYFTPAYLRALTARIEGEVTRLLDDMAPLGGCDLVERFSSRLPLFTLCEILGVPEADRPKFWSGCITWSWPTPSSPPAVERAWPKSWPLRPQNLQASWPPLRPQSQKCSPMGAICS